jgi:non-heme Fe2+,alpha-ketoglutarate-dependent halogenase
MDPKSGYGLVRWNKLVEWNEKVSTKMPKILTNDQIEQYQSGGYVYPVRAMSERDAAAATAKIEEFEADYECEAQQKLVFQAYLPFRWMNEIIRHPRILDSVEDLLGPNLLCWGGGFFQKNAQDPRFVSWHQDSYYYGLDPSETCTAWLAFTPSNLDSGCVRVLPGSHKGDKNLTFVNEPHKDNLLIRGQTIQNVDLAKTVPMVLQAGEFSLHHEAIVHGSDPNNSGHRRIGLSIHYISPDVQRVGYNKKGGRPTASLVRGIDEYNHWSHAAEPAGDFDPEMLAMMDRTRAEFFQRGREGKFAGKPART